MENLSPGSTSLILFFVVILLIIPFIFYLITLQNTLKVISPENRRMTPSQVWLLLIPLFGIVWHFIMVSRISDSIKSESLLRNIELKNSRPCYTIGLTMCILNCISIFPKVAGILSSVATIGFLFCWIIYWYQIASYKRQIMNSSIITLDAELYSSVN